MTGQTTPAALQASESMIAMATVSVINVQAINRSSSMGCVVMLMQAKRAIAGEREIVKAFVLRQNAWLTALTVSVGHA